LKSIFAAWNLDTNTKTLTISGMGAITALPTDLKEEVKEVVIEEGITR